MNAFPTQMHNTNIIPKSHITDVCPFSGEYQAAVSVCDFSFSFFFFSFFAIELPGTRSWHQMSLDCHTRGSLLLISTATLNLPLFILFFIFILIHFTSFSPLELVWSTVRLRGRNCWTTISTCYAVSQLSLPAQNLFSHENGKFLRDAVLTAGNDSSKTGDVNFMTSRRHSK